MGAYLFLCIYLVVGPLGLGLVFGSVGAALWANKAVSWANACSAMTSNSAAPESGKQEGTGLNPAPPKHLKQGLCIIFGQGIDPFNFLGPLTSLI